MPETAFVAAARDWLGTPFHWGASVRGVGADCKGLISGVARELNRPEADSFEATFAGYGRRSDPALLEAGMARLFDPVSTMEPGDLLLIAIDGLPQHLAIYSGNDCLIHAYAKGPRQVIEVPLRDWTVHSIWRWRNVG